MKLAIKKNKLARLIPKPTILRLCKIYSLMVELGERGIKSISSKEIGQKIGVGSHNIRKDISYLGETGTIGSGYEVLKLKKHISHKLEFGREKKACVVGLDQFGSAMMNNANLFTENYKIIAGFDSNINKLETIKTAIPVYPTHEITNVVESEGIELAVMTVSGNSAHEIAERLIRGGIKGIINFSSFVINSQNDDVFISNIDVVGEFRYLSALFTMEHSK